MLIISLNVKIFWSLLRSAKFLVILLSVSNILVYINLNEPIPPIHIMSYNNNFTNSASCYSDIVPDDLPSADDLNFTTPIRTIFFHETSCKGDLDSREACAVESAARVNPKWQINVLFSGPVNKMSLKAGVLYKLSQIKNVKLWRVHITEYSKGTLLEYSIGELVSFNLLTIGEASYLMKHLSLHKFGGIVLDLDVVVMRSFNTLARNFVTLQFKSPLVGGMMSLSRNGTGRDISRFVIREIHKIKRGNLKPVDVVEIVLPLVCSYPLDALLEINSLSCEGFEFYDSKLFYPSETDNWLLYYLPNTADRQVTKHLDIYTHYMWSTFSKHVAVPRSSYYAHLAKTQCPMVYDIYGDNFGT